MIRTPRVLFLCARRRRRLQVYNFCHWRPNHKNQAENRGSQWRHNTSKSICGKPARPVPHQSITADFGSGIDFHIFSSPSKVNIVSNPIFRAQHKMRYTDCCHRSSGMRIVAVVLGGVWRASYNRRHQSSSQRLLFRRGPICTCRGCIDSWPRIFGHTGR